MVPGENEGEATEVQEPKAYDVKVLLEDLKEEGLELAEDAAGKVYHGVKKWLKDSAALSANKFDDLVVPFLDELDDIVEPQIDKIDGEVG